MLEAKKRPVTSPYAAAPFVAVESAGGRGGVGDDVLSSLLWHGGMQSGPISRQRRWPRRCRALARGLHGVSMRMALTEAGIWPRAGAPGRCHTAAAAARSLTEAASDRPRRVHCTPGPPGPLAVRNLPSNLAHPWESALSLSEQGAVRACHGADSLS